MNESFKKFKDNAYYCLIGIISFISVVFLPMLNSEIDVEYKLPESSAAWCLWIGTRVAISLLNVLIFHCFVRQGDTNTKNNANRLQAEQILMIFKEEKIMLAQSPKKFFATEYSKKIPTILLSTALSLFAFGQAIMSFDLVTFTTYLFTCVTSLIFGVLEMFKVEDYYEKEYLLYAKRKQAELEKEREEKAKEELKAENCKKIAKSAVNITDFRYLGKESN